MVRNIRIIMLFKNVATRVAMGGHLTDPKNISVCQE